MIFRSRDGGSPLLVFYLPFSATNDSWLNAANFVGGEMRGAVAGANAARHAGALSRPVRGGVGQLDAVAASQPAAMADGCVAQDVGTTWRKAGILLVHNTMLKPSRSIKMLTFMLLAAVGRLDGDKRLEERRRNCCKGCVRDDRPNALLLLFMASMVALLLLLLGWDR